MFQLYRFIECGLFPVMNFLSFYKCFEVEDEFIFWGTFPLLENLFPGWANITHTKTIKFQFLLDSIEIFHLNTSLGRSLIWKLADVIVIDIE